MNRQTIWKRTEAAFIEPMQCKPVTALPANGKLTFEIKFDGYRLHCREARSEVRLFSRNKKVPNKRFRLAAKKWDMAAPVASQVVKVELENAAWLINLAYSVRRSRV